MGGISRQDPLEDRDRTVVIARAVAEHRFVVVFLGCHKNAFDNAPYATKAAAKQDMPESIQLLSTDFDGTVHAEFQDPPVPPELVEEIAGLQARGARWVINTGRDLSSLLETLARARLPIWPDYLGLVEREIYVRRGHEYHPCTEWNEACTKAHADLFARMQPDIPHLTARIEERFEATLYQDPFSPLCMIASNNHEADQVMEQLEAYCAQVPDLTVVRNDIYARFSHARYNKGEVVAEIARQLAIGREQVFAAGDHLNDLPMLDGVHAAMVAAPDNAVPEVKALIRKVGGFQATTRWGHGVAEALRHFARR
ncbi:MAG TPA: hypothetical protein DCM86_11050 [Verrucomicrobiales bacterium]|nr:hypothetical protein [Verrucomicrobiales bacterium]